MKFIQENQAWPVLLTLIIVIVLAALMSAFS